MARLPRKSTATFTRSDVHEYDFPSLHEQIIIKETRGRKKRRIVGTVHQVYDNFISVQLKGKEIYESFLKVDFMTGRLELIS